MNIALGRKGVRAGHTALSAPLVALIAIVVLIAGVIGAGFARAQTNPVFTVSNPTITASENARNQDGQLVQWAEAVLSVEWSAAYGWAPGDSFGFELPTELKFRGNAPAIDLTADDGTVGGTCTVDATSVTCTLNDAFQGKDSVHGTVSLGIQPVERTSESSLPLKTDAGMEILVPLPAGAKTGIGTSTDPEHPVKNGWVEDNDKTFGWQLVLPGAYLQKIAPEGQVTVRDTLGGKHLFVEKPMPNKQWSFISVDPTNPAYANPWGDPDTEWLTDSASFEFSADNKEVVITLRPGASGQWDPARNYRLYYYTKYTGEGQFIPAVSPEISVEGETPETASWLFGNHAVIENTQEELSSRVYRIDWSRGTIAGVGRGSFAISKKLSDGSATIPDGTEFQVQVDVDSPIDSFDETYVLKVPLGGEPISGNKVLPAGTTVTLSEPTFPELDGITFGEPRFSSATAGDPNVAISADGTKATITTIADTNVAVVLTNTANEVPPTTPETTPPTSTPETTPETTPPTTTPATPTTTPVTPTTPATPPSVRTTPTPEVPSTSVPRTPTGLDETPTEVARAETPAPTTPSQPAEKTLANTGATYTQWALAIGGLAVALGFVLIRRARKA
ncbi:Uncharacterised protein [Corynebacterium renale]|uniref:Ig-like domain-containing protein n=1 Tax=Corynebacterium renale TaxID=1724 RepID=UPI000DA33085|nr:Ig-like domain-containing protein [Corynebacterium renale]SQG63916.1 Uncharacterised protein [Corynebacterium renale]STD02899.1 Uncharacterised protein [Corynebacterium renale]